MDTFNKVVSSSRSALIAELQDCSYLYKLSGGAVNAVDKVCMSVAPGDKISVRGPSGSGKSTLLSIFGMLDKPSTGTYFFDGNNVGGYSNSALAKLRSQCIGFVFQQAHLLSSHNAVENVALPLRYDFKDRPSAERRATELLCSLGLKNRLDHLPSQLSGGERQRVVLARALVGRPKLILADEPSGSLDPDARNIAIANLMSSATENGAALIVVTHDAYVSELFPIRFVMNAGRLALG